MPEPEGKKRVRVSIDDSKHAELRVLAAQSGIAMSEYCETIITEAVDKKRVIKSAPKEKSK